MISYRELLKQAGTFNYNVNGRQYTYTGDFDQIDEQEAFSRISEVNKKKLDQSGRRYASAYWQLDRKTPNNAK